LLYNTAFSVQLPNIAGHFKWTVNGVNYVNNFIFIRTICIVYLGTQRWVEPYPWWNLTEWEWPENYKITLKKGWERILLILKLTFNFQGFFNFKEWIFWHCLKLLNQYTIRSIYIFWRLSNILVRFKLGGLIMITFKLSSKVDISNDCCRLHIAS